MKSPKEVRQIGKNRYTSVNIFLVLSRPFWLEVLSGSLEVLSALLRVQGIAFERCREDGIRTVPRPSPPWRCFLEARTDRALGPGRAETTGSARIASRRTSTAGQSADTTAQLAPAPSSPRKATRRTAWRRRRARRKKDFLRNLTFSALDVVGARRSGNFSFVGTRVLSELEISRNLSLSEVKLSRNSMLSELDVVGTRCSSEVRLS